MFENLDFGDFLDTYHTSDAILGVYYMIARDVLSKRIIIDEMKNNKILGVEQFTFKNEKSQDLKDILTFDTIRVFLDYLKRQFTLYLALKKN